MQSVFILLQNNSKCFGCRPHSPSRVHKTVVTATGTGHMIVQLPHCNVANLGLVSEVRVAVSHEPLKPVLNWPRCSEVAARSYGLNQLL